MKKLVSITFLIIIFCVNLFSQVKVNWGIDYVSRYIWRGYDLTPDNNPNIQPQLTLDLNERLSLNVWATTPVKNREETDDYLEMDYTLTYSRSLSKVLDLSAGILYYTFPSFEGFPDKNSTTTELFLILTNNVLPFNPSLSIYYDMNMGDGVYINFSGSRGLTGIPGFDLNLDFAVGYTDQFGVTGISDINIGISKKFGLKGYNLFPRIVYIIIPNDDINNNNEFWFGIGIHKN